MGGLDVNMKKGVCQLYAEKRKEMKCWTLCSHTVKSMLKKFLLNAKFARTKERLHVLEGMYWRRVRLVVTSGVVPREVQ